MFWRTGPRLPDNRLVLSGSRGIVMTLGQVRRLLNHLSSRDRRLTGRHTV
jgi:hypothetical protein